MKRAIINDVMKAKTKNLQMAKYTYDLYSELEKGNIKIENSFPKGQIDFVGILIKCALDVFDASIDAMEKFNAKVLMLLAERQLKNMHYWKLYYFSNSKEEIINKVMKGKNINAKKIVLDTSSQEYQDFAEFIRLSELRIKYVAGKIRANTNIRICYANHEEKTEIILLYNRIEEITHNLFNSMRKSLMPNCDIII